MNTFVITEAWDCYDSEYDVYCRLGCHCDTYTFIPWWWKQHVHSHPPNYTMSRG